MLCVGMATGPGAGMVRAQEDGKTEAAKGGDTEPKAEAAGKDARAGGASDETAAPKRDKPFLQYAIEASGFIGFVILALSIYMVALVIRLFMEFRVKDAVPPPLIDKLETAIKERKFQEAYDLCRDDNSYLAKLVRTGVANLPNGRPEAKEAMSDTSDELATTMEVKASYLATVGSLGPMLGLLGTVWGMILAFQNISRTGSQPRPEILADNIATALFTTLEGIILAVPAIFFFAFFRNRIALITMEANKVADRTINAFWMAAKQQGPGAKAPTS
jgi:biopolymer transport protein ExbB